MARRMSVADARSTSGALSGGARGGHVILGSLTIFAGIFCMIAPAISGLASVLTLGVLLAVSGLLEVVGGIRGSGGHHRGLLVAGGLLSLAVGLVMAARPAAGMLGLTLLLSAFFFGAGLFSVSTAIVGRYARWGLDLFFGLTALGLGVTTLLWPESKLFVLGTLVGIAIVVRGATMIAAELGGPGRVPAPTARAA